MWHIIGLVLREAGIYHSAAWGPGFDRLSLTEPEPPLQQEHDCINSAPFSHDND